MLYALLAAVHAGYAGKDRRERVQRQVDVMVWRLSADLDLIERFYKARAGGAGVDWYVLNAKLKLLGHGVECLAFATVHDVVGLTPSQREQRQAAVTTVRRMLRDLEARDLGEIKALDREVYRQVIGDTCHARHGLTLA
jgi:GAF domain-containing protein